jgi:hypothetical protein
MNVPSLKRMQNHSPSAGQSRLVAFVSGPRNVRKVFPLRRVTAISKWLAATERNFPPCSLWQRQTLSTKGEYESLSSKKMKVFSFFVVWFAAGPVVTLSLRSACQFRQCTGMPHAFAIRCRPELDELSGATVLLASDAASFVTGHLLERTAAFWQVASINNANGPE